MRFLMKLTLPYEPFNSYVRDGSIGNKMDKIMAEIKPEAAYFTTMAGNRGGILILNLENTSQIPAMAEPWFLTFNATLEFEPVMTPEDLAKSNLEALGKQWG